MSGWLFGPMDLDLRYHANNEAIGSEPNWLPKSQPDAYLDAEFKLQERVAIAEAAKRVQQKMGMPVGAALGIQQSPSGQPYPRSSPRFSGGSARESSFLVGGAPAFEEHGAFEMSEEDEEDDDDVSLDYPMPPLTRLWPPGFPRGTPRS